MKKSKLPVKLLKQFRKLYRIDRVEIFNLERTIYSTKKEYVFRGYEYYLTRLKDGCVYGTPCKTIKQAIIQAMGSMECVSFTYFRRVTRRRDELKNRKEINRIIRSGVRINNDR